MRVLGIDLGLARTGAAWRRRGAGSPWAATTLSPAFGPDSLATRTARVAYIVREVAHIVQLDDIESVWVEGYAYGHGAKQGAGMAGTIELGGALKFELHRRFGFHVNTAPVATARLVVLGNGGLNKKKANAAAREIVKADWGEDALDAWVIMRAGELALDASDDWWGQSVTQRKAVDRLRVSNGLSPSKTKGAA